MRSEKKPSDEAVSAVEKWSETPEVDAVLFAYEESPMVSTGWRWLRDAIAELLDAQRDAVLDEVNEKLRLDPYRDREWISGAIGDLRR